MSASVRVWADALDNREPPYRATEPLFGFDDTEQVNILRAAVAVAAASTCFYLLAVGLIIIL